MAQLTSPPCCIILSCFYLGVVSQVPHLAECWRTQDRSRDEAAGVLVHAGCHSAAFSDITVAIATMIGTKFHNFLSAPCLGHVMPHALRKGILVRFRTRLVRFMKWTTLFYSIA